MNAKKNIDWKQYIGMAFMLLVGAFCGVAIGWYIEKNCGEIPLGEVIYTYAVLMLSMCVALYFHTVVHEAGHLVCGLLTGYGFCSFRIASFVWVLENGKLRLKRYRLAGTGGQCLMSPPDLKEGKMPVVLYNLGGVFANVFVGALCLVGALFCSERSFLTIFFLVFALAGFASAMLNGIPLHIGGIDNDGYNAFALANNTEAVKALWIQLKVAEQSAKGIRIKDMSSEWFVVPSDEAMKNSMVAALGVLASNRLMDEGRLDEADALMAHLLEIESGIVGLHRSLLMNDRIFVELLGKNRSDVIENMLTKEQNKFMKAMKTNPSVLRTQYALALLGEKDIAKAEAVKCEFEKVAKSYPYPQEMEGERELMRRCG